MTSESYAELMRTGTVIDLAGRAVLRFSGKDRTRYLNGQLTANVQALRDGAGLPTCVTTAKGKLCAVGFVTRRGDELYFDSDSALRDQLFPRFERYIIADDVMLDDVTDSTRLLHIVPGAAESLDSLQQQLVGMHTSQVSRYGVPGIDVFLSFDTASGIVSQLSQGRGVLAGEDLETFRIERGIPHWGAELDENTLPPEAGLDRTHIDYHKGCYIGQEVISRIKSVGHVNRRLVGFVSATGAPLCAGWEVAAAAEPGCTSCGSLTSVAWSFALEKPIALGYLRRSAGSGELIARPVDGGHEPVSITVCELPFTK